MAPMGGGTSGGAGGGACWYWAKAKARMEPGGELGVVSAVHARGPLPRRALGSGVLLELRASGEVENRRGSSSGWRCLSLLCARVRGRWACLCTHPGRAANRCIFTDTLPCAIPDVASSILADSACLPLAIARSSTPALASQPRRRRWSALEYEPQSRSSKACAFGAHTCVANPIPTSTHASKDTTHPLNPPQWSPRHDWDPVSHTSTHSANALPLAPPDAPALPAACAFASTTPCHTSAHPRPRARLICRRPHRHPDTHWQRARRACCTSAAPRTAPPAVSRRKAWGKRRLVRCTNRYRLTRCTHTAAVFLPAESEACVAPLLRAAARRCATARVTLHRRQGSGHAP